MRQLILCFVVLLLFINLGCSSKKAPTSTHCLDKNGDIITGAMGKPLPADSETCRWVKKQLADNNQVPCRDAKGLALYDELGRPFMDDGYCPQARKDMEIQRQSSARAAKK